MKTLVMGLGNDLLADDAVGVMAVRKLREHLPGDVDTVETAMHGMALLDMFIGYDRAILIDAIQSGDHDPGDVFEIDPSTLSAVACPSPHYVGLPELIIAAGQLDLDFPEEFRIVAVEVCDMRTLGGDMTPQVAKAIDTVVSRVLAMLK